MPVGVYKRTEVHSRAMRGNKYFLGKTHSAETKERISKSLKGRIFSDESRLKMSTSQMNNKNGAGNLGKSLSAETKSRMSKSKIGNKNGTGNSGNQLSKEHRTKISLGHILFLQNGGGSGFAKVKGYYTPKKTSNRDVHHYRSVDERSFMEDSDSAPKVIGWEYEVLVVPYHDGTHHTLVDFVLHYSNRLVLVEVKAERDQQDYLSSPQCIAIFEYACAHNMEFLVLP